MTGGFRKRVKDNEAGFSLLEVLAAVIVLAVAWIIIQGLLDTSVMSREREHIASTARSAGNTLREMAIAGALTGDRGVFTSGSIEWRWQVEYTPRIERIGQSGSNSLYVRHAGNASALAGYRADLPVTD